MMTAFNYLKEKDEAFHIATAALPTSGGHENQWVGIGFTVGQYNLLIEMNDVLEIVSDVEVTPVPAVQPWFKGIVNLRGSFLYVFNVGHFIFGAPKRSGTKTSYIVLQGESGLIGLVVDTIHGMRAFEPHNACRDIAVEDQQLAPYLSRSYQTKDEYWHVMNADVLIGSSAFNSIAMNPNT